MTESVGMQLDDDSLLALFSKVCKTSFDIHRSVGRLPGTCPSFSPCMDPLIS
jgi:hypothetical protein